MVFVVGIAVIGYALPAVFGGNGFLSVYIVGIVLGNTEIRNKRNLVNFFDGLTGLMQMLIFFLLGLLAFPSRLPQVVLPALFDRNISDICGKTGGSCTCTHTV